MTQIKLIAIDIDGTLLNSKKQLTLKVIAAIQRAKQSGLKVVLCSGRPAAGARQILRQLGLDQQDNQYLVSFGGSQVITTSGKILAEQPLTYEQYCNLEVLARQKNLHFHVLSSDRIYTANRDIGKYTVNEANLDQLNIYYRTPEEMKSVKMIKAMFIDEAPVLDHALRDEAPFARLKDQVTFAKSAPYYLEVNVKNANKGNGLRALCQKLNLTSENVMAIGDEANDLSMIQFAKYGVAMGNAISEVKAAASWVTRDNNHDGVAVAIEKLF